MRNSEANAALDPRTTENYMPKVILLGAIVGALVGVGAAYLYAQAAERDGHPPELSAGEGVKVGLLVLGLVRSIANLGEGQR